MQHVTLMVPILGLFTVLTAYSQPANKTKIPAIVVDAFHLQYPKTCDTEWKKVGKGYEVAFGTGTLCAGNKMLLDSVGKIIYHKMALTESKFPERIKAVISQQFSGYQVCNAEKIVSHGSVTYIAEFKKDNECWIVAFGNDGKVLAKVED